MPTVPGPKESDKVLTKEKTPLMIPKPRPDTKEEEKTLLNPSCYNFSSNQISKDQGILFVEGETVLVLLEKPWKAGSEKSSAWLNNELSEKGESGKEMHSGVQQRNAKGEKKIQKDTEARSDTEDTTLKLWLQSMITESAG